MSVVVGCFESALTRPCQSRHLLVRHLIIVAQSEDQLLLGRKGKDGFLKAFLYFIRIEVFVCMESGQ